MAKRLRDKVIVVTGGASGIGRESVLRFVREGAQVVVGDVNEARGRELVELISTSEGSDRVVFSRCDVSDERAVEALVELAIAHFGALDCMFNNAGLPGAVGALTEVAVEDWDRTFAVMVRGVFLGIKHAARRMGERGGSIVNTASIAGLNAGAGPTAYSTCKAAVIALTRSAAVELAPARIRVNALCPGLILTPLLERGQNTALAEVLSKAQPWPEAGLPEHIADAAVFFASDESRFITGETLVVDGGLTARGPGVFARGNPVGKAIANSISSSLGGRREGDVVRFDPGTTE